MARNHDACLEVFSSRLLRKAYRPERRHGECPEDVYACEKEFKELIAVAEKQQPMDRGDWHTVCNEFSDRWEHVCHWVHPSRLADVLTENLELEWVGEYPPRPDAAQKAKIKSNIKAQRFRCAECSVVCNSYSQYVIHSQGTRHAEALLQKTKSEALLGRTYKSPGAIPLDLSDAPAGASRQPQAYFKRDKTESGHSGSDCGSVSSPPRTPETHPKQQVQRVASGKIECVKSTKAGKVVQEAQQQAPVAKSRSGGGMACMATVTAMLAFSVPLDEFKVTQHNPYSFDGGYTRPEQHSHHYQQQYHQAQNQHAYGTSYADHRADGMCEEEVYSTYAGYNYGGGDYYDYSYGGHYEEPTISSGGSRARWNEDAVYPSSYIGSTESQVGVEEEEADDEEEEEETTPATEHGGLRRSQSFHGFGLCRAWTTPEGSSDRDYCTDGEDQCSNSSYDTPVARRKHRSFSVDVSDASSVKSAPSCQDFDGILSGGASSDADTVTVYSMESKVDQLVTAFERISSESAMEPIGDYEPEVVSGAVLRACASGSGFNAEGEEGRVAQATAFVKALPAAEEVSSHLSEDLLAFLEAPPAVSAVTEEMEAEQVSFIDEKNAKAVASYLDVFCLAAHLFAAGLLTASAFNEQFASFLAGLTSNDILTGNTRLLAASTGSTKLQRVFEHLGQHGMLDSVVAPNSFLNNTAKLPARLERVLNVVC